ncbi:uncharacterized protein [Elaeis guineensis]|uniref:Uncharacterized protein LOC105052888 isoform X6 n=1 Tax=Elaeis guineensis var. tenera TaxID=51953 RepID=A0A8N4F1C2_ELAGV|nr:uncharacterized protein LOC105052888 isoform X6 [Elaeis guineensis]
MAVITATVTAVGPPPIPAQNPLSGRRIAFTTPLTYAGRLTRLLELHGANPLPVPTVAVEPTPRTLAAVEPYLHGRTLDSFAALAFTSRTGIAAFALALAAGGPPPLAEAGEPFTVAALGKDAELLHEGGFLSRLCRNTSRIKVLVPEIASPAGLVAALGDGLGRRVLCPVPTVVDLEEPPVIPTFVGDLEAAGWIPVRVPAYETRWAGPGCVEVLMKLKGTLDAMVFTSSAEVEGLMKGLEAAGWDWEKVIRRWPEILVGAHGPVTAKGVERFGVRVDVVSSRFSSFDGILEALASKLRASSVER